MIVHAKAPSGSGTLTACGKGSATDAIAEHGERVTCVACLKAIAEHQERCQSAAQPPGPPPTTVTQAWRSQNEPFCEYPLPHLPDPAHHYDAGGIPSIDVIRAKLTPDQYEGYLLGNAIKYALRYNHKGEKRKDASKMADYACWLSEHLGEGD